MRRNRIHLRPSELLVHPANHSMKILFSHPGPLVASPSSLRLGNSGLKVGTSPGTCANSTPHPFFLALKIRLVSFLSCDHGAEGNGVIWERVVIGIHLWLMQGAGVRDCPSRQVVPASGPTLSSSSSRRFPEFCLIDFLLVLHFSFHLALIQSYFQVF